MNLEEIKNMLIKINQENCWAIDDRSIMETLRENKVIYKELLSRDRWWTSWLYVTEFNGVFIGYEWATTDGDNGIWDVGWTFDWNTVTEMEPKEIVKIVYMEKK